MPACKLGNVACIKIESIKSAKSTNVVELDALGPGRTIQIEVEADTGATITVVKAEMLGDMDWLDLEPTNVHIKGYSGIVEPCIGKATVNYQRGARKHQEVVFFSNETTSNFLSRDACKAFGIIPQGFPHEQLNSLKQEDRCQVG